MVKKTIIPATKKLGKELIKEASPEHKLKVCTEKTRLQIYITV